MENKYYTPEIEEFHVGFEYEEHALLGYKGDENVEVREWQLAKVETAVHMYDILLRIERDKNIFRVKHLDREDIESLGFKLLKKDIIGKTFIHKDNSKLQIWWNIYNIIDIDNGQTYEDCITYFKGTIKNKSELVKILKMISIT